MDLRDMMKEASLTNLDWLEDPQTFEPKDLDQSKIDDLELQWQGGGDISMSSPPTTIQTEMNVRNPWRSVKACVESARVFLNQGIMGKELVAALKTHFPPDVIEKAVPNLRDLVKGEGLIGCVAIDLRCDDDHTRMIKAAQQSPFKRFIKYVLMTPKQVSSHHLVERQATTKPSMTSGSIDGLLENKDSDCEIRLVYKPLNLPILIASQPHEEYVDEEYAEKSLMELAKLGLVPDEEIKRIKEEEEKACIKLRRAFRLAYKKRIAKQKHSESASAPNVARDYVLENSEMDVQFESSIPSLEDVEVNSHKLSLDVDDASAESLSQIEMKRNPTIGLFSIQDLELSPTTAKVDEVVAQLTDFELEEAGKVDVDMTPQHLAEFKGVDEVILDEEKKQAQDLKIRMDEGFEIEF